MMGPVGHLDEPLLNEPTAPTRPPPRAGGVELALASLVAVAWLVAALWFGWRDWTAGLLAPRGGAASAAWAAALTGRAGARAALAALGLLVAPALALSVGAAAAGTKQF